MSRYEKTFTGQFEAVVNYLQDDIDRSGITLNVVEEINYTLGDTNIAVRVYDKYFVKNGNRASLSLTVVGHGNDIFVSAVGAGGGQGAYLNFSLSGEDDMVSVVRESIRKFNGAY